MAAQKRLSIGDVAARTGLSVSAIRFYEGRGLVHPERSSAVQRVFLRSDIRRLSFIMISQQIGLTIEEISDLLASLPERRTPTKADWSRISTAFRHMLDERIALMERTRDKLDGCIGCGCLSLKKCQLYNPEDRARNLGTGPRFVLDNVSQVRAD